MERCIYTLNEDEYFSLKHTVECGQFFRWEKINDWYYMTIKDIIVKIRQKPNTHSLLYISSKKLKHAFLDIFFRFDDNLKEIVKEINKDTLINEAINEYSGMRILRQDPWECLISYIISAKNNIPAIRRSVNLLSERYGKKIKLKDYTSYSFPTPKELKKAGLEDLEECGLAFRSKYVLKTTEMIADGQFSLEQLKGNRYEDAKEMLMCLPGVGEKVADCVCLFALDKLEAFPVDVWTKRAIQDRYFADKIISEKKAREFGRRYFGRYAGYAQEYLFHYKRNLRSI